MEKKHKQRIIEKFPIEIHNKKIVIMDIEDIYQFMDDELIDEIKSVVEFYI